MPGPSFSREKLDEILSKHGKWLEGDPGGERADLSGANLKGADLKGVILKKAILTNARLEGANIEDAHLEGAQLRGAHLEGAQLGGAHLERADLYKANLERAYLWGAHLEGADLSFSILKGTDLRFSDFRNAEVAVVTYDRKGKYRGIRVETCFGSPQFKRHAQDMDWLEEFLETRDTRCKRAWARIWRETSDYGRDIWRWIIVSVCLAVIFGIAYSILGAGSFDIPHLPKPHGLVPTPDHPIPVNALVCLGETITGLITMIYYSVVTFTTLGFGDVIPKNLVAAALVMAEVITGYIMLGGLISIFANKLARRS